MTTPNEALQQSLDAKVARLMCLHGNAIENMRGLHQADSKRWSEKLEAAIRTEFAAIAQPEQIPERNFCERCGQRLGGSDYIHTCTPPVDANYDSLINSVKTQPAAHIKGLI